MTVTRALPVALMVGVSTRSSLRSQNGGGPGGVGVAGELAGGVAVPLLLLDGLGWVGALAEGDPLAVGDPLAAGDPLDDGDPMGEAATLVAALGGIGLAVPPAGGVLGPGAGGVTGAPVRSTR